jgi:hypothetical protein
VSSTAVINGIRQQVDRWRTLPNPSQWQVTPETARLLQHWRHHKFGGIRPFFCRIEAVEMAIWLTKVAPKAGDTGKRFLDHLADANSNADPELMRLALKRATGAGKTTVMAMLIVWQTINAVRHPQSKRFTRGFLVVAPGLAIRDRLRMLQPNDPASYYHIRELVPGDMIPDLERRRSSSLIIMPSGSASASICPRADAHCSRARRPAEHARHGGANAAAGDARAYGHEEYSGDQRRSAPLLPGETRGDARRRPQGR